MHPLHSIIEHKRRIQKLRAIPFDPPVRSRLVKDYLRHFVLGRHDRKAGVSRVAGLEMPYCTLGAFEYLFGEVFVKHGYLAPISGAEPVILDGGSNIGMSVLFFHLLCPRAKITAFEPQPAAFEKLRDFISRNHLADTIQAHRVALTDKPGTMDFFIDDESPGSLLASCDPKRMPRNKISVEAACLSSFVNGPVDLLKLDVEGAELAVLAELAQSGRLAHIRQIVLEYHHHIDRDKDNLSELLQVLEGAGFGYQMEARMGRPFDTRRFQDMTLFAYAKQPR